MDGNITSCSWEMVPDDDVALSWSQLDIVSRASNQPREQKSSGWNQAFQQPCPVLGLPWPQGVKEKETCDNNYIPCRGIT